MKNGRFSFSAWGLSAIFLVAAVASAEPLPHEAFASQSIGFSKDGSGIVLVYRTSAQEERVSDAKASAFLTRALEEFERQFPQKKQNALVFTVGSPSPGVFEYAVRAMPGSASDASLSSEDSVPSQSIDDGPVRPDPSPGYPATPNEVTDVVIRQFRNGYRRDTQFSRPPARAPDWQPGPWKIILDTTTYVGNGGGGGSAGGGGGGGVVIVHPPISEENPQ